MRGKRPAFFADPGGSQQPLVTKRFHARARVWEDLYVRDDLISVIVRHRHNRALAWIDGLRLQPGSPALEIGPGAGMMTTALAQRRFLVTGADAAPGMIEIARRRAAAADVAGRVGLLIGDANRLPFADGGFSLVVALGVLAWLRPASTAIGEMTRVLRPGGYLIVNAENRHRLNLLLDPRHYPVLDPARLAAKEALRRVGITRLRDQGVRVAAHRLAGFDRMLADAGLQIVKRCTLGYGPFTLMGLPALPDQLGVRLNARLQAFADRGVPGLRSTGGQYLVLAYRPPEHAGPGALTFM
jgi:ubiquinone/menaquinone biosynthesis C-methylase UbiE